MVELLIWFSVVNCLKGWYYGINLNKKENPIKVSQVPAPPLSTDGNYTSASLGDRPSKPLVSIGWILAVDERDLSRIKAFRQAADQLHQYLSVQFPQFQWDMPFIHRALFSPHGALDPLPLLEAGMHEKTSHVWDYALVVVPNELTPLERIFTIGVPSSALEVAALSSARLNYGDRFSEQLSALATHLLGHMWGLEHAETGPMVPPEDCDTLTLDDFSESEQEIIIDRLEEVADQRLEEQQSRWSWLSFYWHTFWADPQSIFIDVLGYKPWRLPIRMGRLTAAALASILVLVLAAESWEIGTNLYFPTLVVATVLSIFIATILLFFGQNLNNIAREVGWREQLTRTRIVLFQTLLVGMITVWGVLFTISFITALFIPRSVTLVWSGLSTLGLPLLAQHAAFMATTGVLAAALGGNLEEEDTLKAKLFFDEET